MATSINAIRLTPDCKYLTIQTTGNPGNATANIFNNGELVLEYQFVYLDNSGNELTTVTPINIPIATLNTSDLGVITVDVLDGGNDDTSQLFGAPGHATAGVLSSCELDCCLAKKVLELTDCGCNDKCDKDLAQAQKLFLYIQSIKTLLAQTGLDLSINSGIFENL